MQQVSFFLEKFKSLGLDQDLAKQVFLETVFKILGVKLLQKSVTLKDGTFFVKAHPTLKSELYIKRGQVLAELSKTFGLKGQRKIR